MNQQMNRRLAIRNMALILGSAVVLPSCLNDSAKPLITLKYLDLNAKQQTLVSDVAETIFPKTQTPGASELGINLFVLKMVDDCYKKDDQEFLRRASISLTMSPKSNMAAPFPNCRKRTATRL